MEKLLFGGDHGFLGETKLPFFFLLDFISVYDFIGRRPRRKETGKEGTRMQLLNLPAAYVWGISKDAQMLPPFPIRSIQSCPKAVMAKRGKAWKVSGAGAGSQCVT